MRGTLVSATDPSISYPVVDGVPILLREAPTAEAAHTLETFGSEWSDFGTGGWIDDAGTTKDARLASQSGLSCDSERDFLRKTGHKYAGELSPSLGRIVLDAGCGNGRFSREASKYAERVIAVDASEAAHVAFRNMRTHNVDRVGVVRASVLDLPFANEAFDYAFSIGVLQHTGDAQRMVSEMARVIPTGNRVSLNCYGTGSGVYELVDATIRARTVKMSQEEKLRFARRVAGLDRALLKLGKLGRRIDKMWRRAMCVRPTLCQMYDWYAPAIAEHYSPEIY